MTPERHDALRNDLWHAVFAMIDGEPDMTADDAGRIAQATSKAFAEAIQADQPTEYEVAYRCPNCQALWTEISDCPCDSECPNCGTDSIELIASKPYRRLSVPRESPPDCAARRATAFVRLERRWQARTDNRPPRRVDAVPNSQSHHLRGPHDGKHHPSRVKVARHRLRHHRSVQSWRPDVLSCGVCRYPRGRGYRVLPACGHVVAMVRQVAYRELEGCGISSDSLAFTATVGMSSRRRKVTDRNERSPSFGKCRMLRQAVFHFEIIDRDAIPAIRNCIARSYGGGKLYAPVPALPVCGLASSESSRASGRAKPQPSSTRPEVHSHQRRRPTT